MIDENDFMDVSFNRLRSKWKIRKKIVMKECFRRVSQKEWKYTFKTDETKTSPLHYISNHSRSPVHLHHTGKNFNQRHVVLLNFNQN